MFGVAFRYVALKARLCLALLAATQGKTLFLAGRSETLRPTKEIKSALISLIGVIAVIGVMLTFAAG